MDRYVHAGSVRYCRRTVCVECYHERSRRKLRSLQTTSEFREWRNEYNQLNIDRVRATNRLNAKRYRDRRRILRSIKKLRDIKQWEVLV